MTWYYDEKNSVCIYIYNNKCAMSGRDFPQRDAALCHQL